MLESRLLAYSYEAKTISIAREIIPDLLPGHQKPTGTKYEKAIALIEAGNRLRIDSQNNAVLAAAVPNRICGMRGENVFPSRLAYIVTSLKHPEEVGELRRIYGGGFYLIAIHSSKDRRLHNLMHEDGGMSEQDAERLAEIDEHESKNAGQHTRDTFHLADFFVADENNDDKLKASLIRCLDLIFGNPVLTPTFNEFAMFTAFTSSLRSADLSRQVGAVITKGDEILSTGANDCPKAGGGLYWPIFKENMVQDVPDGRDYMRRQDSNSVEKSNIINEIVSKFSGDEAQRVEKALRESKIGDITEYGRVVHAEMEALMACARSTVSCQGGKLFCTTFPCHNCAKHIIAAGIMCVVYIEPYPKSKALVFHSDAVTESRPEEEDAAKAKVRFMPFIGVGPRRFFDLFAMSLGSGRSIQRKTNGGKAVEWNPRTAIPRVPMLPASYMDLEQGAAAYINGLKKHWEASNAERK